MRSGFKRDLDFQDIYNHVTLPERVFLLRNAEIKAMASYNKRCFAGHSTLIVEGICIDPSIQGKGFFEKITRQAIKDESLICLRTQNPIMYKALANYCRNIYPNEKEESPDYIKAAIRDFARYLECVIDSNGVVKGYYGGLFYGKAPSHKDVDPLLKKLGVNLHNGDGLLVIGINPQQSSVTSLGDGVFYQDGEYYDYSQVMMD